MTITFSKATNAPPSVAAIPANFLQFSSRIASVLTAAWSHDATSLSVTINTAFPSVDIAATRIGVLLVSFNASMPISAAVGSDPGVYSTTVVTGTWGTAKVPSFAAAGGAYAPSFARNTGGQAGLGFGDSLMLRFDTPCKLVPVETKSDLDKLLSFSTPIGEAYTGQWETSGRFAFAALVVTVTRALPGTTNVTGASVGSLHVAVFASANMTSLDESTGPSNATTLIAMGTWGDVPLITAVQRTYRSLRVTIAPPQAAKQYGWTPDSYELDWTVNATCASWHAVNRSNLLLDGTAVCDLVGLPAGVPVYLRAAARATIANAAGELLAPLDELGPFALAPAAFVTQRPVLSSVSIGAGGTSMAAVGSQIVTLRGQWLGIEQRDISVSCTNGNVTVNATKCTVEIYNEVLACLTSPGVGHGFVWSVSVGGVVGTLHNVTSSYNVPTVRNSARVARVNASDVFELYGHDFGPINATVERAFLYSPSDAAIVFDAAECNVSVADTTIVCSIPDGAGTDLLWSVVIGGQKSSAPTVAYAVPVIHSFTCSPAACDNVTTTGGDTIVLRGANFGPATHSPNFLAAPYGGVYFVAPSGTRYALLACNVTVSQVQAECSTPSGFGLNMSVTMTVLRQASAAAGQSVSYAVPFVSIVGVGMATGGALLVKGSTVIVTGHSLGAPGYLLLNELPVMYANVEAGHRKLVFYVDVLPFAVIGERNVSVRVSLQGIKSNSMSILAAPPAIASQFPLSILDAQPAGACPGVSAVYWVALSGTNFGLNDTTTSLSAVGMQGASSVCSITDTTGGGSVLVFGINASSGSLMIVMGHMSSARVAFNSNDLLQPPTLSDLQNATSAKSLTAGTYFRTSGGDVLRIVGANFRASDSVFLAPIGVMDAGSLPPNSRFALSQCTTTANSITAATIDCIVPPGVGSNRIIARFARGVFVSNSRFAISYTPPNITSIVVLSTTTGELDNAGGRISIHGTSFGTHSANVTVTVGGLRCPIRSSTVRDTSLECDAPAIDDGRPQVEVNVGGQIIRVIGMLLYAPPLIAHIYPATSRTIGTVDRDDLEIFGSNFGVTTPTVVFVLPAPLAPVMAKVLVSTQTAVTVEIPHGVSGGANNTRVSIEVHTTTRFTRLSQCFEYLPPMIASVSPTIDAVGCSVDGCVLTIVGDNFGSPRVLLSPPVVLVNDGPCEVRAFDDTHITCTAPPGSGSKNTVTVRLLGRTAVLNGTAFAYSAPAVSSVLPPVVDQHVIAPLLLIGTNFARTHLAISISGVPCSRPTFINSSAVECREAQFLAIGHASIVVSVNGQVSNVAAAIAECRTGYFGRHGEGACIPCPAHAWCAGQDADPLALAGYWQSGRTSFVACVPPGACAAGVIGCNGSTCTDAYSGVECRLCSDLHYRSGTDCIACPQNAWVLVLLFVAGVMCSGGLAAWMHRKMFNIKGLTIGIDMMQASIGQQARMRVSNSCKCVFRRSRCSPPSNSRGPK